MNNLKYFLDEKAQQYNHPHFIETDPIQIPHLFSKKEDIEISGLLTALIAWGKREMIIRNAREWMRLMDDSPHDFILNHKSEDLKSLREFKHRTFQFVDTVHFLASLQNIYRKYGGLRHLFSITPKESDSQGAIMRFREVFFSIPYEKRTQKHISNPEKGSASKRLNMFLRWMVRKDCNGVDLGIWSHIPPSKLSCPLDIHSARVARKLGMLSRKENDIKAVIALDKSLRYLDKEDPVKYDFALFGLGVFENF